MAEEHRAQTVESQACAAATAEDYHQQIVGPLMAVISDRFRHGRLQMKNLSGDFVTECDRALLGTRQIGVKVVIKPLRNAIAADVEAMYWPAQGVGGESPDTLFSQSRHFPLATIDPIVAQTWFEQAIARAVEECYVAAESQPPVR